MERRSRRSQLRSSRHSAEKTPEVPTRPSPAGSPQRGGQRADKVKRQVASARRPPDARALKLSANLAARREADCPFRKSFARRADAGAPKPLLARLVGAEAGRAAEPRIKLVVTLLWLAREGDTWTVEKVPAATWALLFGLYDPEKAGATRVTGAIKALKTAGLIEAEQTRGREPRLRALHEAGDTRPWSSPVGERGKKHREEDYYSQLNRGFWANGWITVLSSRAIAALLILLDATWDQKGTDKVDVDLGDGRTIQQTKALRWWHLTEEQLTEQYAVSRDLFDRGVNELLDWGLVESRKRAAVDRTSWGERRWYRELRVRLEVLGASVQDVWDGTKVPRVGHSSETALPS